MRGDYPETMDASEAYPAGYDHRVALSDYLASQQAQLGRELDALRTKRANFLAGSDFDINSRDAALAVVVSALDEINSALKKAEPGSVAKLSPAAGATTRR